MAASPMVNTTGTPSHAENESAVGSSSTDECLCPPVARRARLDGVDLAALSARVGRLRFPAPNPDQVIGASVESND